jgi:hypothetical protein
VDATRCMVWAGVGWWGRVELAGMSSNVSYTTISRRPHEQEWPAYVTYHRQVSAADISQHSISRTEYAASRNVAVQEKEAKKLKEYLALVEQTQQKVGWVLPQLPQN